MAPRSGIDRGLYAIQPVLEQRNPVRPAKINCPKSSKHFPRWRNPMARRKKSVEPSIDDRIRDAEAVVERLKREKQDSMVWVGQLPQGAEGQSLEEAVENAERLLKELMDMQADGL